MPSDKIRWDQKKQNCSSFLFICSNKYWKIPAFVSIKYTVIWHVATRSHKSCLVLEMYQHSQYGKRTLSLQELLRHEYSSTVPVLMLICVVVESAECWCFLTMSVKPQWPHSVTLHGLTRWDLFMLFYMDILNTYSQIISDKSELLLW